jgi:hypothetical protein
VLGDFNADPTIDPRRGNSNRAHLQELLNTCNLNVANLRHQPTVNERWTWRAPWRKKRKMSAHGRRTIDLTLTRDLFEVKRLRTAFPLLDGADHKLVRAEWRPTYRSDEERKALACEERRRNPCDRTKRASISFSFLVVTAIESNH